MKIHNLTEMSLESGHFHKIAVFRPTYLFSPKNSTCSKSNKKIKFGTLANKGLIYTIRLLLLYVYCLGLMILLVLCSEWLLKKASLSDIFCGTICTQNLYSKVKLTTTTILKTFYWVNNVRIQWYWSLKEQSDENTQLYWNVFRKRPFSQDCCFSAYLPF